MKVDLHVYAIADGGQLLIAADAFGTGPDGASYLAKKVRFHSAIPWPGTDEDVALWMARVTKQLSARMLLLTSDSAARQAGLDDLGETMNPTVG